jgi:hypothetical protein
MHTLYIVQSDQLLVWHQLPNDLFNIIVHDNCCHSKEHGIACLHTSASSVQVVRLAACLSTHTVAAPNTEPRQLLHQQISLC